MANSQCGGCQKTFSTVEAFDLHRTGSFSKRTRHCLSEEDMQAKGMTQNTKGWWMAPQRGKRNPWARPKQEMAATAKRSP